MKKDKLIQVRISEKEKIKIRDMAKQKGMTLSEFTLYSIMRTITEEQINKLIKSEGNMFKNERGAGRKEKLTQDQKARAKVLRIQGLSYRKIAENMECSVATIYKIINK